MPPALALGLGGLAANVVGGAVGNAAASGDKAQALALQQNALKNIQGLSSPTVDQLKLALSQYQTAGQLTPEMEATIAQDPSLMNSVSVDPRLRNAQLQSLAALQKVGAGGLRPEDMAALANVRNSTEQQANSDRQAVMQSMQQRGIGGSGAELAAQLGAGQSAANRANTAGLDIAGQASQRALQAISGAGSLGSSMEGQQFGEAAQQANAQDVINRYNAMNSQQVGNANTTAKNAAQATNLGNLQSVMNQNTGVANQQAAYNANLPQQVYQNQLGQAQAAAGVTNQAAGALQQNAAQTQNMWSGLGQAAGQGIGAIGAYNQNQDYMDILKGLNKTPAASTGSANSGSSFDTSGLA